MKRMLLWLCLLALCASASAEALPEGALSISVEAVAPAAGEATVTLVCEAPALAGETIRLFAPEFNGDPAAFPRGRTTQTVALDASGRARVACEILSDDEAATPEALSLRAAAGGAITEPMEIPVAGSWPAPMAVSFDRAYVLNAPVEAPADADVRARAIEDRLPPEDVSRLERARVRVCLRAAGDALYAPIVTLDATADGDGQVRAAFSGFVPVLADRPDFALPTEEADADGRCVWRVGDIALYSEAVYFARLTAEIARADGGFAVAEQPVQAEEFDLAAPGAPVSLFDEAYCALPILHASQSDEGWQAREVDSQSIRLPLDGPLSLKLVPAEALGEVWYWFEYDYDDGTRAMHAPTALK